MGTYRLFNNPSVEPAAIQQPHRQRTLQRCGQHPVVLCVQDTSTLDYTHHPSKKGLGPIDRQNGQGLLQHTVLAVLPGSTRLLGVLNQRWQTRVEAPPGENTKRRRGRWRESLFWAEGVQAAGSPPPGTRFITVADRGADCFETFEACRTRGHGWILRAQHDRCVNGRGEHLWPFLNAQPLIQTLTVKVPARAAAATTNRGLGGKKQPARQATLEIRVASGVSLDPPKGDPDHPAPLVMNGVYAREINPPAGLEEPIDWMLLSSEPVDSVRAALRIIAWYRCRWVIEEYHKVQKSGCRLEDSQLRDVDALRRLAAVVGVCAVRLLWLRDLASQSLPPEQKKARPAAIRTQAAATQANTSRAAADDPEQLAAMMPPLWITVVARLCAAAAPLTPRQFWQAIARRGGWLGRKHDCRPGWKALWDGWHEVALLVEGATLAASG
jgi:hypothetical protein